MIDPAIAETNQSDYTAIPVVGVTENNHWYVLDYEMFRGKPQEIINRVFKIYERYPKIRRIGVETVAYQKALVYAFKDEMRTRGIQLPLVEVGRSTRVTKELRIKGILQPIIEQRRLHIQEGMIELREQLRTFPRSKHDDILDSLSSVADIQSGFHHGKKKKEGELSREEADDKRDEKKTFNPRRLGRSPYTKY
jgi:predicted phage terminase large subunit-like protein